MWIQRQLAVFQPFTPSVLTEEIRGDSGHLIRKLLRKKVAFSTNSGHGWRRWPRRLFRSVSRNFYHPTAEQSRHLRRTICSVGADEILCHFGPVAPSILPIVAPLGIPLVAHFMATTVRHAQGSWYRWSLVGTLNRFAVGTSALHLKRLVTPRGALQTPRFGARCKMPMFSHSIRLRHTYRSGDT